MTWSLHQSILHGVGHMAPARKFLNPIPYGLPLIPIGGGGIQVQVNSSVHVNKENDKGFQQVCVCVLCVRVCVLCKCVCKCVCWCVCRFVSFSNNKKRVETFFQTFFPTSRSTYSPHPSLQPYYFFEKKSVSLPDYGTVFKNKDCSENGPVCMFSL